MDNKSEDETDDLVTDHGVGATTNDNTQERTPLFDTLCVMLLLLCRTHMHTHNKVTRLGSPQGILARINARNAPDILDNHPLTLSTRTHCITIVQNKIWKQKYQIKKENGSCLCIRKT